MKNRWPPLLLTCLLLVQYHPASGHYTNEKASLFDSYGNVTSEDISARLDNFANQLQNETAAVAYVIGYGPEGKGSGTGSHLLEVTKDYLANSRGIDAERVQTVYAGRYKEAF